MDTYYFFTASRIQENDCALTDYIFTDQEPLNLNTGVIISDLSDHLPTFVQFPCRTCENKNPPLPNQLKNFASETYNALKKT
jgi:hypothetical protein